MVEFVDGAAVAQLSMPDMRLPIGYALAYPDRLPVAYGAIDWTKLASLDFEEPDRSVFPCLELAYRAGRTGDLAPAWLNAANEVAVAAFLAGRIGWPTIAEVVELTLDGYEEPSPQGGMDDTGRTVEDVLDADATARRVAESVVSGREAA
jgi:1-deoxy-D-xylulose-5-phosphate reductoisomerase